MRKLILAGAVSAIAAFPAITHAATSAGDGSLGGTASVTFADDTDFYTTVGFGSYFFTDMLEGSFRVVWSGQEDESFVTTGVGLQLNFLTDNDIVPFVGASYDYSGFSDDPFDETDFYSLFGGARFFVAENVSLRAEVAYRDTVDDSDFGGDSTNLLLGIEWFF